MDTCSKYMNSKCPILILLEEALATHSSTLAWRIPGTGVMGDPGAQKYFRLTFLNYFICWFYINGRFTNDRLICFNKHPL